MHVLVRGRCARDSSRPPAAAMVAEATGAYVPALDGLVRRIHQHERRADAWFGPFLAPDHRSLQERTRALHVDLVRSVRATNDMDRAIGRVLRRFRYVDGVAGMGYARLGDYARERLGQSLRWSQERLRLDRLFEASSPVAAAHGSGALTTSHVLAIAPMIAADTAAAWIALAKEKTVRELKTAVREAKRAGRRMPEGVDEPEPPAVTTATMDVGDDSGFDDTPDERDWGGWVSIPAPAAVADLFDHTLDIARRVAGSHQSVASCIEHMLAEYEASAPPPPADDTDDSDDTVGGFTGDDDFGDEGDVRGSLAGIADGREARLEAAHDRFRSLAVPTSADVAAGLEVSKSVPPTPRALDAELRRLILLGRDRHDRLAKQLAEFRILDGWRRLGFASLAHYCREALGISSRLAQELERVATRLHDLPAIAAARARGELSWTKLRLITSVARPDSEAAWLERARRCTVRYLERDVHAAHRRREVDPGGWAHDGNPEPLTHAAPYGEDSPLRPGAGLWDGAHASAPVDEPAAAAAHTSAIDESPPGPGHTFAPELPCRIRFWLPTALCDWWLRTDDAIADRLDLGPDSDPNRPSEPWQRFLVLLRHTLHQWDTAAYERWSEGADTHRRFGWMCACPGCTARRNLEQHHIVFRSRGGSDDPSNLVTLCATHHRQLLHEHRVVGVSGRSDRPLEWSMPAASYRGDIRDGRETPRFLD